MVISEVMEERAVEVSAVVNTISCHPVLFIECLSSVCDVLVNPSSLRRLFALITLLSSWHLAILLFVPSLVCSVLDLDSYHAALKLSPLS